MNLHWIWEIILSWLVTWRFRVTREEPELLTDSCDFTILIYVIFRRKSSEWLDSSIENDLRVRLTCNMES